ncbi:hypothetical protein IAU59_004481 [Kwoniella sp. CBS 9459]
MARVPDPDMISQNTSIARNTSPRPRRCAHVIYLALLALFVPSTNGLATGLSNVKHPLPLRRITVTSSESGSPQFAGCISADSFSRFVHSSKSYGLGSSQVDEESCVTLCKNKNKYSYAYYREQSAECYCSHSNGPLPTQIEGGCDSGGECTPCQGSVTYLDSPLLFEGCYPRLSGTPFLYLSDVEPHMDLEVCLRICSTDVYDTEVVGFRAVELDSRGKPSEGQDPNLDLDTTTDSNSDSDSDWDWIWVRGEEEGQGDNHQPAIYHRGPWHVDDDLAAGTHAGGGQEKGGERRAGKKPAIAGKQTQKQRTRIGPEQSSPWGWECACYSGRNEGAGVVVDGASSRCGKGDYWRYVVSPSSLSPGIRY